jgi:peptidoglycan/LPS O-acetylase OafA/YrhL
MEKNERYIPVLDGVRGLAIAMVLGHHCLKKMPPLPEGFLGRAITVLIGNGWVGVDLFFVLSGFLITGILYDTRESQNYFRAFYARRFLRIFPLYYGVIFLLLVFSKPLQVVWEGQQFLYLAYLQNIGITHYVTTRPFPPPIDISHFWSLAVEEQFYFVWPAVVFLLKDRRKIMRMSVILILCSIVVRVVSIHFHRPYMYFTPARVDSLMVGGLLALAFRSGCQTKIKLVRGAWIALPSSVAVLIGIAWHNHSPNWQLNGAAWAVYTVIAIASAALMTLALTIPVFQAVFNRPTMRLLGKYSYGIYVLHCPAIALALYLRLPERLGGRNPGIGASFLALLIAILVSIGLAILSFEFYESRFLRLKKYFRYRFSDSRERAEGAPWTTISLGAPSSPR